MAQLQRAEQPDIRLVDRGGEPLKIMEDTNRRGGRHMQLRGACVEVAGLHGAPHRAAPSAPEPTSSPQRGIIAIVEAPLKRQGRRAERRQCIAMAAMAGKLGRASDGSKSKQTERQRNRQTDRDRQTETDAETETYSQADRQRRTEKDRQTGRQASRQADRQADTDRHTER